MNPMKIPGFRLGPTPDRLERRYEEHTRKELIVSIYTLCDCLLLDHVDDLCLLQDQLIKERMETCSGSNTTTRRPCP